MRFETLIGLRYTRAARGAQGTNRLVSFISLISMAGAAVGVAALIVVLSVMNGFQEELRSRILGVASHIQITGMNEPLQNWQQVADEARQNPHVLEAAPYVQEQAMLSHGGHVRGVMVRGVLPADEEKVADFARYMREGQLEALHAGGFGIVLGQDLARMLNVGVGGQLTLVAPQGMVTPAAVLPRVRQFTVVGIFEAGMQESDTGLALIHMSDAQALYRLGDGVTGVRLKTDDIFNTRAIMGELASTIHSAAYIYDWTHGHANFFRAVAMEKTMMSVVVFLIVLVAAFGIVSTLVMAVQDKRADIAILRTLGASPRSIMMIFVLQGVIIGIVGLLAGIVLGLLLANNLDLLVAFIEKITGLTLWSKEIYYISELPSKVLPADIAMIAAMSFSLTLLATLYPSWRAARTNPAEALRYE